MKYQFKFFFIAALILAFFYSFQAYAVDANSETAAAESKRFEQEKDISQTIVKTGLEDQKKSEVETADQSLELSQQEAAIRFVLQSVDVSGNQQFTDQQLLEGANVKIGQEVNLGDLRQLASQIKKYYRDRGFIAAYAYVPPQSIDGGHVEIAVVEGVLDSIEIKNNRWFSEKVLRRFLRLVPGQILYLRELQSALIFLNKHEDIKIKAFLKPGETQKTTKLELDVKDQRPLHFSADVNNLGTQNTGRTRVGLGLTYSNLFGQMDEISSRFQIGSGAVAVGADYSIPIHSSGTRLGFGYSYSHIKVGGDFKPLRITGDAHVYSPYVLQPLVRRDWIELVFNTGMDFKQISNNLSGTRTGHDSLRIWNLGVNSEFTDRWGKTYFPHTLHFGFSSFLGASESIDNEATRSGTGAQFFIYRTSLIRYHRLPWGLIYAFRGQAQLTNDRLPPSEQFRLGGAFSVRGYSEGEYLSDYGAFITNEIYIPSYFFPKDWKLPYAKQPLREQIQGVGFFDFGGGALRGAQVGEEHNRSLAGMGLGVRMRLFDKVFARAQWATPTGSSPRNGDDSAFYYGVTTEFI